LNKSFYDIPYTIGAICMYDNMPTIAKLKHWTIQLSSLWNVILFGARFFIILFERTIKEQFLNVSSVLFFGYF